MTSTPATSVPESSEAATSTVRLTVGQAIVRFLGAQHTVRDGVEHRLVEGFFGIFGHGNVAGLGQALLQSDLNDPGRMPYWLARNEQGAVHAATGFARHRGRLSTLAVTTSIGPGATNMITGAALATINRIPVLLFPADVFATRNPDPVLQQLERSDAQDVTVNDAFRPVSVFFDRVWRPEQLPAALLGAMRALTDPAQTGAVTIALPQDVQPEAHDWPVEFFDKRVWRVMRQGADAASVDDAAALLASAKRPFIVAGGGVHYSEAEGVLAGLATRWGIPVGQSQAGKGALPSGHPFDVGGVGATGTTAANALAAAADVVIGVGTRYSDFTTASRSIFANPDVRFINLNVAQLDAVKFAGLAVTGDARTTLAALGDALPNYATDAAYRAEIDALRDEWAGHRAEVFASDWQARGETGRTSQVELIGILNETLGEHDVIVNAAGSAPGDLHKLWEPGSAKQYHVEYGFSTMGYEIAGALGIKLAEPGVQVVALVGDGSYLMLAQELVTAIAEGLKLVIVLIDNEGFASIGNLSESVGSQRFGTRYRYNDAGSPSAGGMLPVDLAANLESLGAKVLRASSPEEFRSALKAALAAETTTAVYVQTDPLAPGSVGGAWWDVPVAEVSELESTQAARRDYERDRRAQRPYL
ncbi:3D-(3,5/4)-trihydroxycyclohexane-1,2-dione acylhydrolase (decyclizing) [Glaciibacter superstes]|uniref:3D-(3,5/4)-trihydroxycyclohexane-1,2-dione acylhydrolase (decyclizing) n=1 Tax=Glaciibacter superstes TaxID=501023 RepID=UPI0003B4506E|nr:3D-(3,5/4)-trihydroxycyclohexane-1,2-dione acylhydrolase (decyclizing) [Glaciibacter superstes]